MSKVTDALRLVSWQLVYCVASEAFKHRPEAAYTRSVFAQPARGRYTRSVS